MATNYFIAIDYWELSLALTSGQLTGLLPPSSTRVPSGVDHLLRLCIGIPNVQDVTYSSCAVGVCFAVDIRLFDLQIGGRDAWQSKAGQAECFACPKSTQLRKNANRTHVTDCICKHGHWRPDGERGHLHVAFFCTRALLTLPLFSPQQENLACCVRAGRIATTALSCLLKLT